MDNSKNQVQDMPAWLIDDENYNPKADKDTFLTKSILSVFRIISRIKMQDGANQSVSKLSVTLKVLCTFLLLILLSLTRSFLFVTIINVYFLVVLSFFDADKLVRILKMSIGVTLFTALIMVPAIIWGNYYSCIMITAKVFSTITAVGILSHTSRWNDITGALSRFYIPGIFIMILDITIKYLYLLGNTSLNLLYALKLRSVGKNNKKYSSMGGIAGNLFLQSREMAEEMYHAMECRGFSGEYYINHKSKLGWEDYLYLSAHVGFVILFIYFARV